MEDRYFEGKTFENLNFEGEVFEGYRFVDSTFINCSFSDCKLSKTILAGCIFDSCSILNLISENNSSIQFTQFRQCQIASINWGMLLCAGRFPVPIASFDNCKLKYATFTNMDMKKFDFSHNEITHSIFAQCNLAECSFGDCQLHKTEFYKSDLRKSDFRNAKGYEVDIFSCKIKDGKFSLPEVLNLLNALDIRLY